MTAVLGRTGAGRPGHLDHRPVRCGRGRDLAAPARCHRHRAGLGRLPARRGTSGSDCEAVARALRLAPELLHEPVDGERSFTGKAARLVFADDAWFRRVILGDRSLWQQLDLLRGEMPTRLGVRLPGLVGRRQDQPGLGSHRAPK
jgi:hypothetical protein